MVVETFFVSIFRTDTEESFWSHSAGQMSSSGPGRWGGLVYFLQIGNMRKKSKTVESDRATQET